MIILQMLVGFWIVTHVGVVVYAASNKDEYIDLFDEDIEEMWNDMRPQDYCWVATFPIFLGINYIYCKYKGLV